MNIKKNILIAGTARRPVPVDIYYISNQQAKPVIVFAHGFKGFKDWGFWDLLARAFAEAGFVFVKFNFSHNGTTPEHPADFVDLEAFGKNNYSLELSDLDAVLEALLAGNLLSTAEFDQHKITLAGHSRGGGITLVKAAEDARVAAWLGWAPVNDLAFLWRNNEALVADWKEKGVLEIRNGRTKQIMPLYFQLYEDFEANAGRFDLEQIVRKSKKPMCVIQGTEDLAVPLAAAKAFKEWNQKLELHLIEGADHVFGGSHPWEGKQLPEFATQLLTHTLGFLI